MNDIETQIDVQATKDMNSQTAAKPVKNAGDIGKFKTDTYTVIKQAIMNEITNDPEKMGYAGKKNAEILSLLNNPIKTEVTSTEEYIKDLKTNAVTMKNFTRTTYKDSRLSRILSGIPYAPNTITDKDLTSVLH